MDSPEPDVGADNRDRHARRLGRCQGLRMGLRVVGEVARAGTVGTMVIHVVALIEPVSGVGMGVRAIAARLRDQRHHRGRDQHECSQHRQEPPDPFHPRRHASARAVALGPQIHLPISYPGG